LYCFSWHIWVKSFRMSKVVVSWVKSFCFARMHASCLTHIWNESCLTSFAPSSLSCRVIAAITCEFSNRIRQKRRIHTGLFCVFIGLFCAIVVVVPSHRRNHLWILKSNMFKETYSHGFLLRIYRPLLCHRRCRAESSLQLPVNEMFMFFLSEMSFLSSNMSRIHVNRSRLSVDTSRWSVNTSLLCDSFDPSHGCNYLWMRYVFSQFEYVKRDVSKQVSFVYLQVSFAE
jgi:hypothetical protein